MCVFWSNIPLLLYCLELLLIHIRCERFLVQRVFRLWNSELFYHTQTLIFSAHRIWVPDISSICIWFFIYILYIFYMLYYYYSKWGWFHCCLNTLYAKCTARILPTINTLLDWPNCLWWYTNMLMISYKYLWTNYDFRRF